MTSATTQNAQEIFPATASNAIQAVLFDLDGTLADTAPDLAAAINQMLSARGLPNLPPTRLRPITSAGVAGLLAEAFGINNQHADFAALRKEFLGLYTENICIHSKLFPAMDVLLADMSANQIPWGIVTNKLARLAELLVTQLGLRDDTLCIVGGDTTPHAKPHPAPLLHAAAQLKIAPAQIVYVGDDLRDIQAGHAAGMLTVAAAYGYCGKDQSPDTWNADYIVDSAAQLHTLLLDLIGGKQKE